MEPYLLLDLNKIKEKQIVYFLILTGIAIATAAGSFLFPVIILFFVFIYNYYQSLNKSETIYSINDQLVISLEKVSNSHIDGILKCLIDNGVNAEVQSINKQEDTVIIVLKLSDFDLDKLTIVEDFLVAQKIKKKEIQFFSSTE